LRRASARKQRSGSEPDRKQRRLERRRRKRCRGWCRGREATMLDTWLSADSTGRPAHVLRLLSGGARQWVSTETLRGRAATGTATRDSQPSDQRARADIGGGRGDGRVVRVVIGSRQSNGERRAQTEADTDGDTRSGEQSGDARDRRPRGGVASAGGVHGTVGRQCGATSDEGRSEAEQQAERGVGS
jgi:hypothetical protein